MAEYKAFALNRIAELRAVYDSIDNNNDGHLTTEELRQAANTLGLRISSEQLRELHRRADSDHDGRISFDEFSCFLLLLPSVNPRAIFEAFNVIMIEHAQSEYTPPVEVLSREQSLLAVLATKLYSGGIAGAISRTVTAPIDRLKMLMQAAPPGQSSGSLADGLRAIHKEGGLPAYFRGNSVNVLKIAPETAIKFVAFDVGKARLAVDPDNVTAAERFVAGGGAGAVAQGCIYPLEICKTRMAVSAPGTYSGIADCLASIVRSEGLPALYAGLSVSVIGIIPYAGIDLSVNSLLKEAAARLYEPRGEQPGVGAVLACGMLSSTCAMLGTYPLNLVRTRLQAAGMPGAPVYAGAMDCVWQTVRAGGVRALYQGIVPNMLKVLPATSISYAVYDRLSR